MTQTLTHERIKRFREIIIDSEFYRNHRFSQEDAELKLKELCKKLAEASKSESEKRKELLLNSDPAWSVLAGQEISEETIAKNNLIKAVQDAFEQGLKLPATWQWSGGTRKYESDIKKLVNFIVPLYEADNNCFAKYHTWRSQPFSRGAVSNTTLQRTPTDFISSWTDFVNATGYKVVKTEENRVSVDSNNVPVSY